MPYSPTFTRNSEGSFHPDKSFVGVRAGTDAYLMEDELNEMQANLLNMTRSQMQTLFRSGPLDTITGVNTSGADVVYFDKFTALADGLIITVGGAGNSINSPNLEDKNYIRLSAKPASGNRTDLIFLEVYEKEVKHNDPIYKYGTIGGKTLPNDLFDQRVGDETSRRLQLVGELRVVAGTAPSTDGLGGVYTAYDNLGLCKSQNGRIAIKLFSVPRLSTETSLASPTAAYTRATMIAPEPMASNAVAPKSYVDDVKTYASTIKSSSVDKTGDNMTGALTFGNKMKLVYNATTDSLDIMVV